MGFSYLPHGLSIQFHFLHVFSMSLMCMISKHVKTFHSSHLWNRGSRKWHMCRYVTLIPLCHTFYVLRELPCFLFSLCLALSSMYQTEQLRRKWIALWKYLKVSVLVVVKCLWFILKHFWYFTGKVFHVITVNNIIEVH